MNYKIQQTLQSICGWFLSVPGIICVTEIMKNKNPRLNLSAYTRAYQFIGIYVFSPKINKR